MKTLALLAAFFASSTAFAENIRIANTPAGFYAYNDAGFAVGEGYTLSPTTYEVGKFIESLSDKAGAICDGKFTFINGEFQIYALSDCKVIK